MALEPLDLRLWRDEAVGSEDEEGGGHGMNTHDFVLLARCISPVDCVYHKHGNSHGGERYVTPRCKSLTECPYQQWTSAGRRVKIPLCCLQKKVVA